VKFRYSNFPLLADVLKNFSAINSVEHYKRLYWRYVL